MKTKHKLPPLPYEYSALEPQIDERTIRIHHDRHHKGYVDGLNEAEKKLEEARENGDYSLIKHWSREAAFHGSGHILHSLYWENMTPEDTEPGGQFADHIERSFGSFDNCREQFLAATGTVEGSGWGVLAYRPMDDELTILQVENHQKLTQWGVHPLLVADAWEHAYYLKYQNKRGEYLENFMQIVNWDTVSKQYEAAKKCGSSVEVVKER